VKYEDGLQGRRGNNFRLRKNGRRKYRRLKTNESATEQKAAAVTECRDGKRFMELSVLQNMQSFIQYY
jgi:hypothetical protein